ncbi:thioredoxin family protein [Schlesneria paludicola]|uniref:thioredoxin family protein n=1 Tax=Schlesneria paludicola TaxID=360056 RepID=UPI0012FA0D87|nr:thioredoxin family protein [Schlesneria paludicola]
MNRRLFLYEVVGSGFALASLAGAVLADLPRMATTAAAKVKWQPNLKTAQKLAVQHDKPIMIVFGATWCGPCRRFDNETLGDKQTVAMIESEFIPVHLDFDKDRKIAQILEVERVPSIIVLTPDADLLMRSVGFSDPREFQSKLTTALEKRAAVQQARATATTR